MGQWMSATIVSVADTATYRDLKAEADYNSTEGVDDWTNDFSTSGDFPGNVTKVDKDISIPYGGGSQLIHSKTLRVYKTYGATQGVYFAAWIKGINYWGGAQVYDNANYTVPARAYTDPSAPGTPSISSITQTTATASWGDPSDWGGDNSSDFQIQKARNSSFTSSLGEATVYNTNSRGLTGMGPNETWYVRVRAKNAAGYGPWSSTRSFKTDVGQPSRPGQPAASSVGDSSATLGWGDPSDWGGNNTSDFKLQIDGNSSFSSPSTITVYNTNSRTVSGLASYSTYYARVLAFNAAGNGPWSYTRSFRTLAGFPSAPRSPASSGVGASSATLAWTAPSDWGGNNTGDYRLYVSTNSNMSGATGYTVYNLRTKGLTGLAPGTTYYWRVQAFNARGNGDYTSISSFSTKSTPLTAPRSLTVTDSGPVGAAFSWVQPTDWGAEDSDDYNFAIRKVGDPSFTHYNVTNSTTFDLPFTLDPNADYEWTVRAVNSYGNGPYASPYPTFTSSAPPAFVKVAGTWRSVSAMFVKVAGSWRPVVRTWVKVAGTWR